MNVIQQVQNIILNCNTYYRSADEVYHSQMVLQSTYPCQLLLLVKAKMTEFID